MWGEPREGTEAYKVKLIAEKRRKEAEDKNLDDLIVDVFFDRLVDLPRQLKAHKDWNKYKHPDLKNFVEEKIDENEFVLKLSFDFNDNNCVIKKSYKQYREYGENNYYDLELLKNGKKAFSLLVDEYSDEYSTTFSPSLITSYSDDSWADDFIEIKKYYDKASKDSEIAWAENPKRTEELKKDFGIREEDLEDNVNQEKKLHNKLSNKKPFWKSFWFWIFVIILLNIIFD